MVACEVEIRCGSIDADRKYGAVGEHTANLERMLGRICRKSLRIEARAATVGCYVFEVNRFQVETLIRATIASEPDSQETRHLACIVLDRVVVY